VTLSSAQMKACHRHGLDVRLHDARAVTQDTFGPFDAVASLGAFEHFCSPDDYRRRRQMTRGLFENWRAAARARTFFTCKRWCSGAT